MENVVATPRHPIRVVARRTGLTPATIRAWERRYHAVEPARSEGGQRLYSDLDVERLNTLRALTEMGRSIGSITALPAEAAEALLTEDLRAVPSDLGTSTDEAERGWVDDALRSMRALETEELERTLWRAFLSLGAKGFLDQVAAPLLRRIGSAWKAGEVTPAQEHMGSAVLERVLTWIIDPAKSDQDGPRIVVATLPGEQHALGARLAAAAASIAGWRTTYLGTDLPVDEIAEAARSVDADSVAISAIRTDRMSDLEASLQELRRLLDADIRLMVGGAAAHVVRPERLPAGIELFFDLDALSALPGNGRGTS